MNREKMLGRVRDQAQPWDVVVIGGGATGLGIAVDAAARGYEVALFEQADFSSGTSSRSTKLVHGGVRYLQQGNIALVTEALKERGLLHRNAPHLVADLAFVVPSYEWWESPFYGIGLKVYDMLAGRYGFGKSRYLSQEEVVAAIPSIRQDDLRGGTLYYDGQFDDARLALNLAQTAAAQGGVLLNYAPVVALEKSDVGLIEGVVVRDEESGDELHVRGRVIVNATGPFADGVRRLDRADAPPIIAPSQGVHIVLDKSFLPGETAIMVPHTSDGRVMFAIPWHDVAVVGTTDTPIDTIEIEPRALPEEVEFILDTANRYLSRPADHADIKSVFAGIRPLVKAGDSGDTAALSREHTILVDPISGLLTIAGGKWTTYRRMAEDTMEQVIAIGGLEPRDCATEDLPIHGYHRNAERFGRLAYYGTDAPAITALGEGAPVHERLPLTRGEVIWACRNEMARTVDDVLARRSRSLLFDAAAAREAAGAVGAIMANELGRDAAWVEEQTRTFAKIAGRYFA
ncbi:MAG: glycerol-3-phosphate dehydrogenase/oxidase [Planctomycetota bacterium]